MITIRLAKDEDIETIRNWRNSDLVNSVSYNRTYITSDMHKKWFDAVKDEPTQRHWILMYDGVGIGYGAVKGIDLLHKRCELASLYIGETQYLLSGIGAIAEYKILDYIYDNIDVDKVTCEVLGFNKKVIQLHQKLGFKIEGTLEQHYFLDNNFEDVVILSLFRKNWIPKKAKYAKIFNRDKK